MAKNKKIRICQNAKCGKEYELCHGCEDFRQIAFSYKQVSCCPECYLEVLKIANGEPELSVVKETIKPSKVEVKNSTKEEVEEING
jgi:hypothetical protein